MLVLDAGKEEFAESVAFLKLDIPTGPNGIFLFAGKRLASATVDFCDAKG